MKNKAFITVRGTQRADGDENVIEYKTDGEYELKNDVYYIYYNEPDGEDGPVATVIRATPLSVTVKRSGSSSASMLLRRDERHICRYVTPVGEMMLGVKTKKLRCDLAPSGGTLSVRYDLECNSSLLSENLLRVTVRRIYS